MNSVLCASMKTYSIVLVMEKGKGEGSPRTGHTTIVARMVRNVGRNQHQFLRLVARYFVIRQREKRGKRNWPPSLSLFRCRCSLPVSRTGNACRISQNHGKQFDQKANKQRIW